MLKPNSLTSLRNPSSSSSASSYFFQNLIQPNLAISGNKDVKTLNGGIKFNADQNEKEKQHSMRKTRRVQQLAEEVASLLVDEKGLIQKVENDLNEKRSSQKHSTRRRKIKSCIICVGSTGTGKSSTISKCTRRAASSGNGRDRITVRCEMYTIREDEQDPDERLKWKDVNQLIWVDTVGLDDADLEDDSTFKDILRFINDNRLLKVKAIIWTVLPNIRKDALLTKQARLIDLFKPTKIWKNVLIICKQSRNPENDAAGAVAVAKEFGGPEIQPQVLGYTYFDDPSLTVKQRRRFKDAETREIFLIKNDHEVRQSVLDTINDNIGEPIQVVFKNQKCLDCGATGDSRLMPKYCHMEPVYIHPGNIVQYHPKGIERHHDSSTVIREHPKGIYRPWYTLNLWICKIGGERHLCCQALDGQPGCSVIRSCCKRPYLEGDDALTGCRERYQCCKVSVASKVVGCKSHYQCCGRKLKAVGCKQVCKKCDRPWGSPADGCYEKTHNITMVRALNTSNDHDSVKHEEFSSEEEEEEEEIDYDKSYG